MATIRRLLMLSALLCMSAPSVALANSNPVPRALDVGVGGVALLIAGALLFDVLALRRVASGAAIAEHVTYVMAAVVCLAAAVLMRWFVRFSPDAVVRGLASFGSDLLIIAAMAFFGIYFYLVRRAMVRFLAPLSTEEAAARSQLAEEELDAESFHDHDPVDPHREHHG